jgi:hypothetical protein
VPAPALGSRVVKVSYAIGLLVLTGVGGYYVWGPSRPDAPVERQPRSLASASRSVDREASPLSSQRELSMSRRPSPVSDITNTVGPSDEADVLVAAFDSAELDRQLEREMARNEAAFSGDPPDRRWAATAEASLGEDLQKIPGAEVSSLECRTTFCKAVLRYGSYAEARETSSRVAQLVYQTNCAVEVFTLPPGSHEIGRQYEHEVYFDCTDLRVAGVP